MQNNHYIALTLGPIYKTLAQTRRTRHLWGASYLFSYLMKRIVGSIEKQYADATILMPDKGKYSSISKSQAGLFPDRLLLQTNGKVTLAQVKTIIDAQVFNLAKHGKVEPKALQDYLLTYVLECHLDEDQNPILTLQSYLEAMEQQPRYTRKEEFNLMPFLDKLNQNVFYKEAGIGDGFPTLGEIATHDLNTGNLKQAYKKLVQQDAKDEDTLMVALADSDDFKENLRNYHHYIAVVQADGDNVGNTIAKIGKDRLAMSAFSKALFAFSEKVVRIVHCYGGKVVYAGGDDLLFFAPVANANRVDCPTILHLIKALDDCFEKEITNNPTLNLANPKPTLSFGVSVTYYKFPLGEARQTAYELLNQTAKKEPKNQVALSLEKHSHDKADL